MEGIKLVRYKAIPGYGERIWVNSKNEKLYSFFEFISIWSDDTRFENDGSISTLFEMPVGFSVDNCDKAIKMALDKLHVVFVDKWGK